MRLYRLISLGILTVYVTLSAHAYDFQSNGIYYNVIGDNEVEVTKGDDKYRGDVVIPNSVLYNDVSYTITCIGKMSFYNCRSLTSITIPNTVAIIKSRAFEDCIGLTSFSLPNSVINIGDEVFSGCSSLTSFTFSNSLANIGDLAFARCKNLSSIALPNTVSNIGESAFGGCSNLTSIKLPNAITTIRSGMFEGCNNLTALIIPNSVMSIGSSAFRNCYNLNSIIIPNSVKIIESNAFEYCHSLESIKLPDTLRIIEDALFFGCQGLTSVTIPNSVETIRGSAFSGCKNLTSITIPNSVVSIGSYAFYNCSALTFISIPNSVSGIGVGAFSGCSSLISIMIPNGVINIWDSTFKGCSGLMSLSIPNSVKTIYQSAFSGCEGLTTLTIPNSVETIGDYAFSGCNSLATIILEIQKPFRIEENVFSPDSYSKAKLTVPIGTKSKYQETNYWNKFKNIEESSSTIDYSKQYLTFESEVDNNCFIFNGNQEDISYNRTVEYSTDGGQTWTSLYNGDAVIANSGDTIMWKATGLTAMIADGIGTFEGMNYYKVYGNIMSLVYGDNFAGQTTIGDNQFKNLFLRETLLTDAENLILPSTTVKTNCYDSMFKYCISLTVAPALPATSLATSCYANMFQGCTSLTTAPELPAATLAYRCYKSMFEDCSSLTVTPELPATTLVKWCYQGMFQNCSSLNYIKCLATNISATDCTTDWVNGVAATGTFVKAASMSSWTTGTSGIPSGWTITDSGGGVNPTQKITVTADNFTREYGDANPTFTYTSSGGTLNGTPKISCSATKTSPVGTYTIKIEQGSVTNSDVKYVDGTLTITKAPLTITAKSYTRKQGEANPTFEVEYSGFKNGESESVLTKKPTVSTTATTNSPVGTYDINVSGAEAQNYSITYVNGKLTITEKDKENFTLLGISYSGTNSTLKAEVVAVDNNLMGVEIPSSVSYNGKTYQVTSLNSGIFSNRTFDYVSLPSTITSLATNTFINSMLGAFIWNANSSLSSGVFSNMAMTTKSNFLLYVNQKSYAPTNVTNVVVGTTASSITLADGTNTRFYCPKEFTAQSISYTHVFSMTTGGNGQGWETLVLPFDVQRISHSSKGEIVPFASYDPNDRSQRPFWLYRFGTSGFVRSSKISANTPYIIAMPYNAAYDGEYNLAGSVTFSATNAIVKSSSELSGTTNNDKTFMPTFSIVPQSPVVYALNTVNSRTSSRGGYEAGSRFISNLRDVYPFEAYMGTSTAAKDFICIEFEDETTGIEEIPTANDGAERICIYTMSGQLVFRAERSKVTDYMKILPSGIYMIDGRKIIK